MVTSINSGLLILIGISLLLRTCVGQECYNPCDLKQRTCNYVDYPIYPIGLNISNNEAQAASVMANILPFEAFISPECIRLAKLYTCGYLYPGCINGTQENPAPVKVKPCLQMCLDVNEACKNYTSLLPADAKQLINCSQLDPDGSSAFGEAGNCSTLTNLVPVPRCFNDTDNSTVSGCQKYDPNLSPRTNSTCAAFVSQEVFVEYLDPSAQGNMDIFANESIYLISKMFPVLPIGCYKKLVSLFCQTSYPACNRVTAPDGSMVEVGSIPCADYCQTVVEECQNFFSLTGESYLSCSMIKPNGSPFWQPGSTYPVTLPSTNITVTTTCANNLFPATPYTTLTLPVVDKCPSVLKKRVNPTDRQQYCWVGCPDPSFSPKMWSDLVTITLVGGSISFVANAFLLISTVLSAKKRSRHIHISVYAAVLGQSVSFLINGRNPQDDVWCNDGITYASSSNNAACGAQGFLFQWCTMSIVAWWLVIAINMFRSVVKKQQVKITQNELFYHAAAWGIPLIFTIATAAAGGHNFAAPSPWCYIHDSGYTTSIEPFSFRLGIALDYYVFYIPLALMLAIALVLLVIVFYYLLKAFREVRAHRALTDIDAGVQRRILLFVVLLFIYFALILEWRFSMEATDIDKIKNADIEFLLCQLKNDLGIEYSDKCLGDELPERINYPHVVLLTFLASTFGLLIFLAFGTEWTIYEWWWGFLQLRSKQDMINYIKYGQVVKKKRDPTLSTEASTADLVGNKA